MLVQISPTEKEDVAETLCSLNFASKVRGVKLGTAKKQIDQSEIYRCKKMVENPLLPQLDIKNKDIQLKTLEETAPSLVLRNKSKELSYKILQERNKKLETQLIIEKNLAKQNFDTFMSKIKELERQLIIERKLTRQHLYTITDEQEQLYQKQLKQQHQEPQTPMNSVSVARIEGSSRPSLVPISQKVAVTPASRRNSLIPVPNFREASLVPNAAIEFSPVLPTPRPDTIVRKSETKSRGPAKKFTNILRRSLKKKKVTSILRRSLKKKKVRVPLLQVRGGGGGGGGGVKRFKKAIVRVPLPQVGVKRVLVSTGGSVKKARREVVGEAGKMERAVAGRLVVKEARRVVVGEAGKMERAVAGQQKRQLVVKERGWNHATTTKKKNAF